MRAWRLRLRHWRHKQMQVGSWWACSCGAMAVGDFMMEAP